MIAAFPADPTPRFSMIIPAYNEEAWLPRLLDSAGIARERYRGGADAIEIIVADNASTDATAHIARAHGFKVVTVEKRAIAAARNGGAKLARGEFLCFIDADSRIHPETFNAIDAALAAGRFVAGATGIHPERWSVGIAATWLLALPVARLAGMDAGVVFCRRSDFETIGGYDESLLFAEDVKLLLDLKRLGRPRGERFVRARGAITITSARKFDKHGEWHFLAAMPKSLWWAMFSRNSIDQWARNYWYEDR
jgi:glycosyltransferase involved in cell wall biosynthesis